MKDDLQVDSATCLCGGAITAPKTGADRPAPQTARLCHEAEYVTCPGCGRRFTREMIRGTGESARRSLVPLMSPWSLGG